MKLAYLTLVGLMLAWCNVGWTDEANSSEAVPEISNDEAYSEVLQRLNNDRLDKLQAESTTTSDASRRDAVVKEITAIRAMNAALANLSAARKQARDIPNKSGQAFERAQSEVRKAMRILNNAEIAYLRDSGAKKEDLTKTKDETKTALEKLRDDYERNDVLRRFSEHKVAGLSTEQEILMLERVYDQRRIGTYTRAKFERFMQPDVICSAVSQCQGDKNKNVLKNLIGDKMFHDSSDDTGHREREVIRDTH